jgi:type IV pilus modification protein PilV
MTPTRKAVRRTRRAAVVARVRGAKRRAGFTLVSVIVALLLLTVGVMALANANLYALRAVNSETDRTTALQIARSYMETLRGRDPTLLVSEAEAKVNDIGTVATTGRFFRTTTVTVLSTLLSRVTVQVRLPRGTTPIVMETLVYRRPF